MATKPDPFTPTVIRSQRRREAIRRAVLDCSLFDEPRVWCNPRTEHYVATMNADCTGSGIVLWRKVLRGVVHWAFVVENSTKAIQPENLNHGIAHFLALANPGASVDSSAVVLHTISERALEDAQRAWIQREIAAGIRAALDAEGKGE